MTLVRNETQRHSAALKIAGQNPIGLLPLDGPGFAVLSFQLRPVSRAASKRVPPNNAVSRFVGFGDKSWDNFKNFFRTQGFEFLFLSQRVRRADFGGSIAPKTPVLKLNRPLACKPPAAIVSESVRVVCATFAKPQVATLRHSREKRVVSGGLPMSWRLNEGLLVQRPPHYRNHLEQKPIWKTEWTSIEIPKQTIITQKPIPAHFMKGSLPSLSESRSDRSGE